MTQPDPNNQTPLPDADTSLLVAYLDGEVDAATRRSIETRLAADPEFHRQMIALEESWKSLDLLEIVHTDKEMLKTTMELLALNAQKDVEATQPKAVQDRPLRRLGLIGGLLCVAGAAYWIVAAMMPNPNEKLLKDIPVIEHIDYYQSVESMEFLKKLAESGLFDE